MALVESELEDPPRVCGTKSLRQTCLETSIDQVADEPDPHHFISPLPPSLQNDILRSLFRDRRGLKEIDRNVEELPLSDLERLHRVDANKEFIEAHPHALKRALKGEGNRLDVIGHEKQNGRWSQFRAAVKVLEEDIHRGAIPIHNWRAPDDDSSFILHKNSHDSILRFSICRTLLNEDDCYCHCGVERWWFEDLISPELARRRLESLGSRLFALEMRDNATLEKYQVVFGYDLLEISISLSRDYWQWTMPYKFSEANLRLAEILLNAMLSPIDMPDCYPEDRHDSGRFHFAHRYMNLIV